MNGRFRLVLEETAQPNRILRNLINSGVELVEFEIAVPPLNDIFIKVVKDKDEA
jgi:ABC-type uncharacterized transport system ATPase subunit